MPILLHSLPVSWQASFELVIDHRLCVSSVSVQDTTIYKGATRLTMAPCPRKLPNVLVLTDKARLMLALLGVSLLKPTSCSK
jgi:hypothetical protein